MLKFLNILNVFNVTCDSEVVEKYIFYYLFSHLLVVSTLLYKKCIVPTTTAQSIAGTECQAVVP